jgi:hypothetical protein
MGLALAAVGLCLTAMAPAARPDMPFAEMPLRPGPNAFQDGDCGYSGPVASCLPPFLPAKIWIARLASESSVSAGAMSTVTGCRPITDYCMPRCCACTLA